MITILVIVGLLLLFMLLGEKKKTQSGHQSDLFKKAWGVSFHAIKDSFSSLEAVQQALRTRGLESSELIVGVDFTASNEFMGTATFGGKSLHHVTVDGELNPYQQVLKIVANTLRPFDDDHLIPAYGFGDVTTRDRTVFSFKPNDTPCHGLEEVETVYEALAQQVTLSGPTSFAPLIYRAIDIVRKSENAYHILLIIADGQVTNEAQTVKAIVEASNYPLSIIMVGVGDGPWTMMEQFDDRLPQRKFDNFQFVNYESTKRQAQAMGANLDAAVALNALMEIPDQFQIIRKLGMISDTSNRPRVKHRVVVQQPPIQLPVAQAVPASAPMAEAYTK